MTTVKLTYFRTTPTNTKYYTEGTFTHDGPTDMGSICEAVRHMMESQRLPSLADGHSSFHVLVQPEGREPHLLLAPHEHAIELEEGMRSLHKFVEGRLCDNPRTPEESGECRARSLMLARPEWSLL